MNETKSKINIQGNGSIVPNESHAKDLPQNNTETPNEVYSLAEENRTGSPKNTTDNTHVNQNSPTLEEMTEKLKMTMESQKETRNEPPKQLLKRADRETAVKSEESETKEVADVPVQTNANGRTDGTPPLTDSTAQTDSLKIQAQFGAQVCSSLWRRKRERSWLDRN